MAVAAALRLALDYPNALSAAEQRRIEADAAAELLHIALQEPTEAARDHDIDRVLAAYDNMIQRWSAGTSARQDLNRVRADRILALHERSRMSDVINDYNRLLQDGAPIPGYILGAVGDAYLALHQPETARDILVKAIAADPNNYETRRALFYAYVDCGDYDNAYRLADELAADPKLSPDQHHAAQLLAGAARIYGNQIRDAGRRIIPVVAATPAQPSSREALGNLYDAEGWPRQALAQYQSGVTLAHGPNRPMKSASDRLNWNCRIIPKQKPKLKASYAVTRTIPACKGLMTAGNPMRCGNCASGLDMI